MKVEIDKVLAPELEVASEGDNLEGMLAGMDERCWYAEVGDAPIAFPLQRAFQELGLAPPSELYKGFELWVVPHRVSVMRRCGAAEVTSVGVEVEYQTPSQVCSIVSLLPSPEFVTHGDLSLGFQGALSAAGEAKYDMAPQNVGGASCRIGPFEFKSDGGMGLHFHCSATVSTPRLSAVGIGSRQCGWQFDKTDKPLFGATTETWAVVALSCGQENLPYRMRFSLTLRTLFFPTRRESEWTTLECVLSRAGLANDKG